MKSNVCKIDHGNKDLAAIFKECEKVAAYNNLTHKQALQLRLLCEEIDGMLPVIVDEFEGDLWIELENGECKIHVSIKFDEFTATKKQQLIDVAKNKKNAAAVGIVGKIRSMLENVCMDSEALCEYAVPYGSYRSAAWYGDIGECSCLWSLEQYRSNAPVVEKKDDWDELEKSVLASVADDVVVGVKGKRANIIILKKFA